MIDAWLRLEELSKLVQFTSDSRSVAHPRYLTITRTGRTSCSGPNLQQVPREPGLREMYVPSPGHVLIAADYSQIELRVIAHICRERFGASRLAEVFERRVDPHAHTAAAIVGADASSFAERPDRKELRQAAKAINFGVIGGMGGRSLAAYAKLNYGVALSEQQANEFRAKLIHEVYPELGLYLDDDPMAHLARNLGASVGDCWCAFEFTGSLRPRGDHVPGWLRRVIAGEQTDRHGRAYDGGQAEAWGKLRHVCRDPDVVPLLRTPGSPALAARLFASPADRSRPRGLQLHAGQELPVPGARRRRGEAGPVRARAPRLARRRVHPRRDPGRGPDR